jgi:small subunit ribosomal protein S8
MDPIADMLTAIRNNLMNAKFSVTIPFSKMKERVLRVCEEYNLIAGLARDEKANTVTFQISQQDGKPRFQTLKRLSTPGRRLYVGWKEIPRPSGNGIIIISTPQGMMSGKTARHRKLGGELICEIS